MAEFPLPSARTKCNNCVFFSSGLPGDSTSFCFRYPPTTQMLETDGLREVKSFRAITTHSNWCGEFVDRGIPFFHWVSQNQDTFMDSPDARFVINEIICDKSLQGVEEFVPLVVALLEKPDAISIRSTAFHVKRLLDAWSLRSDK